MAHGPIRTALINMLGGVADHQVEALVAAAMPPGVTPQGVAAAKPATAGIIVYAKDSNIIRRIILPDNDDALAQHKPTLDAKELSITAPLSQEIDLAAVKAAVVAATGKPVPSGRAVLIDQTNTVVNTIQADPAIDELDGFTIISSDLANIGDTYTPKDGHLSRLMATVDATSRKVVAIGYQPIDNFMVSAGFFLVPAENLKVGDIIK